jgi:hypothetical protein
MCAERRQSTWHLPGAVVVTVAFSNLLSPSLALAQTVVPSLSATCSVAPSPQADTWPQAVTDSLNAPSRTVTFTASAILANDVGPSIDLKRNGRYPCGVARTSTKSGTIAGCDPFTYTPRAAFGGVDVFGYEIVDAAGRTTVGVIRVNVPPPAPPPD